MKHVRLPGRVVVLGAAGQLGSELCRQLGKCAIPVTRRELDLCSLDCVADTIQSLCPDAVINTAAYTKVDQAETEPVLCRTINALVVREIARACRRLDCPLVQVSTDYVFGEDESRRVPYAEGDAPGPINVYGATKLDGERFAASHPRHFVVRTCGLYASPTTASPHQNFIRTMLRLANERSKFRVVNDQQCTPSFVPHVARAIRFLLSTDAYGIYHVVQCGWTTWFQVASEVFRILGRPVEVVPVSSADYPARARRPKYSVLACAKYESLGGPLLPDWRDALREYLATEMQAVGSRTDKTSREMGERGSATS